MDAQSDEIRSWTGANGKSIEAEFVSFDPESKIVIIRLKNGKDQHVKISLFSNEDQEYIKRIGNTDDPFADGNAVIPSNEQVVRVSLTIDEFGNGGIKLEKTSELPQDNFEGREIKIAAFSKRKITLNDEGIAHFLYDFKDPDPIPFWDINVFRGIEIKREKGVLSVDPQNTGKMTLFGFSSGTFHFPIGIKYDVKQFNGEFFNLEIIFDNPKTFKRSIFACQISSSDSINGPFSLLCRWGTIQGKEWKYQDLLRRDNIQINEAADYKFHYPLPDSKIDDTFRMSFGKNLNSSEKNLSDLTPIEISRLELSGRYRIPTKFWGFQTVEDGSKLVFEKVIDNYIADKAGIKNGDTLISINGIRCRNDKMVKELLGNISFGDSFVFKIEREGKQQDISILER